MNGEKINIDQKPLHILVSPLDWGLGHATRCIPIINSLLAAGARVTVASSSQCITLLEKELPQISFVSIEGYGINYSKTGTGFLPKLLFQLPKIAKAIAREKRWLANFVETESVDAVIADNRMGMCVKGLPCIYMTHQLYIETGFTMLNALARKLHYGYINRFTACWVPDGETAPSLAGKLSHPGKMPAVPLQYIGLLSRFKPKSTQSEKKSLLCIISGPEPQRSIFENLLRQQLTENKIPATLMLGKPGELSHSADQQFCIYNHLDASGLQAEIAKAKIVICRSGYSSVMDLAAMQQKAILVPTPGQGEQVYLAAHLLKAGLFFCVPQDGFTLYSALRQAEDFYESRKKTVEIPVYNEAIVLEWYRQLQQAKRQ